MATEAVMAAIDEIARTMLRRVAGNHLLDKMLAKTETINVSIREVLNRISTESGVEVEVVELKDIQPPQVLMRATAKGAESERERRAKIATVESEIIAPSALGDASDPSALPHPPGDG